MPAFITHYRLVSRGNRFPDMLQDVQRSIQIVRENAEEFGINPDKLGVMGFSAGGYLAGMSGNSLILTFYPQPELNQKYHFVPTLSHRYIRLFHL